MPIKLNESELPTLPSYLFAIYKEKETSISVLRVGAEGYLKLRNLTQPHDHLSSDCVLY